MHKWLPLLLLFVLQACSRPAATVPVRSIYYWRTHYKLSPYEQQFLQDHNISRLYVKYMDVGWDTRRGEAVPISVTRFPKLTETDSISYRIITSSEWIPVIYITNRAMLNSDSSHIQQMATNTVDLLERMWAYQCGSDQRKFKEVQFDCDWTLKTRNRYFRFLTLVRKKLGSDVKLSSTIRLHQYKYPEKTGVPPVDNGMLMLYNIGNIRSTGPVNSIFDEKTAKQYLSQKSYPLHLDVALPAYGWVKVMRDNEIIHLLEDAGNELLKDTCHFALANEMHI